MATGSIARRHSRAGTVDAATNKKMSGTPTRYPSKPMTTAVATLPALLNAQLRPWRASNADRPTSPRLMAATAGANTLLVDLIRTWAA